jgi:hypothetical protein
MPESSHPSELCCEDGFQAMKFEPAYATTALNFLLNLFLFFYLRGAQSGDSELGDCQLRRQYLLPSLSVL